MRKYMKEIKIRVPEPITYFSIEQEYVYGRQHYSSINNDTQIDSCFLRGNTRYFDITILYSTNINIDKIKKIVYKVVKTFNNKLVFLNKNNSSYITRDYYTLNHSEFYSKNKNFLLVLSDKKLKYSSFHTTINELISYEISKNLNDKEVIIEDVIANSYSNNINNTQDLSIIIPNKTNINAIQLTIPKSNSVNLIQDNIVFLDRNLLTTEINSDGFKITGKNYYLNSKQNLFLFDSEVKYTDVVDKFKKISVIRESDKVIINDSIEVLSYY